MAHNGGKLQLNLSFPNSSRDYVFLNLLKHTGGWFNTPAVTNFNAQGYPTSGTPGCQIPIPSQAIRPGNYVVRWDGTHSISMGAAPTNTITPVEGSQSSGSHRFVFTPASDAVVVVLNLGSISVPSTEIAVVHEDDETLYDAGQTFGVKFLERMAEMNPGVIRFMDWQEINFTNVAKWSDRKPVDHYSYTSQERRQSVYAGTTTNDGNDFTVDFDGFVLTHGAQVAVTFNADADAASSTLNVEGTGAKTILSNAGNSLGPSLYPNSGAYGLCSYDEEFDAWLKTGGDDSGNFILRNGAPIEVIVELCNLVNVHPWVNIPPYALDKPSDYATGLATYLRDNLNAGLVPRYEAGNEPWNAAAGFLVYAFAAAKSNAVWGISNEYKDWQGRALSRLGQDISAVYGGDRSRYHVVCGLRTNASVENQTDILDSPRYVLDDGDPASDWVTHLAMTNYFNATGTYGTSAESDLANSYDAAETDEDKAAIAATYLAGCYSSSNPGIAWVIGKAAEYAAMATTYGLELEFYEGGYSPDYLTSGTNFELRNVLRAASKNVPALQQQLRDIYSGCFIYGEFPSVYVLSGNTAWGVLEDIYVEDDPPQWDAIKAVELADKPIQISLTGTAA